MILYAVLTWFPIDPRSPWARLRYGLGGSSSRWSRPIQALAPADLAFRSTSLSSSCSSGLQIIVVPLIDRLT